MSGLMASACNQRRTVEDEIALTSPSRTAWPASSAELHRDNGTWRCSGGSHANALIPATTSEPNRRGRPDRGRSANPASPCSQNRFRNREATSTHTPTCEAMSTFCTPSAANSTIRARTTDACDADRDPARSSSTALSSLDNRTTNGDRRDTATSARIRERVTRKLHRCTYRQQH